MAKDLTQSRLDRQNILNNELAIQEIQETSVVEAVFFEDRLLMTKEMVASFFEVDIRTIERYISANAEELKQNGYELLRGRELKAFLRCYDEHFGTDIYVGTKTTVLGVFDSESEKARAIRQVILDVVIDLINRKTGGGTKYINQRDKDYVHASLQEDNYRRQFTDALKNYVEDNRYKYAHFTDMIYVSIFREKAREYKKILDLKANDKVRDTFYTEILDIIAAYESGLAEEIKRKSEQIGRVLSVRETEGLFHEFEQMTLWKPLIQRGRIKMASRDMALRDAFHYQLSEYIQPLDADEYQKFLGAAGDELERLMQENQEVLRRLKERD